jgi:hypothetical protein
MRSKPWLIGLALSTAVAACSGGGVSQDSFSSSACKKETTAEMRLARMRSLNVLGSEAGLEGLRCVAWKRASDDRLLLDLYNFEGACGAVWTGEGKLAADGSLAVHIDNPSCQIAKCGICLFDWSLDLHLGLPADQAVGLDVAVDSCAGEETTTHVAALIGPEATGIRCALAHYGALNWQATAKGTCGQAGMPCEGSLLCGSGSFTSTGTCAAGLVCDSAAAVNEPVCLVPCTTTAECPRADVYACQAGACRPTGLAL